MHRHVIPGVGTTVKGDGINDAHIAGDYLGHRLVGLPKSCVYPLAMTSARSSAKSLAMHRITTPVSVFKQMGQI
ncbi:MAG: hypothetical protein ABGZ35_30950 [Planctomycetaceae bacterium]